ncbi:carbohydrate kinase family protein [Polaribacter sp.]|uniref:carbohydrate kinase family protein n=1 Tax=Polaribacter sp. TaxID=1920175 RepID=UPI003F6D96DE
MNKFVCFGEVLWDVFPTHKKIGGAPLNVASRLRSFLNDVKIISAVGDDDLGKPIVDFLQKQEIKTSTIQVLNDFETGKVAVTLNKKGAASYVIEHPKAWDKIQLTTEALEVVKDADAFVFGSLATRDEVSKNTLFQLLEVASYKIFDVNIRKPFYQIDTLFDLMQKADFIKFNDEELYEIAADLDSPFHNLEQNLNFIASKTNTKTICVTKGEHGAVLLFEGNLYYNSGFLINVEDTVGSGDSFLASLTHKLIVKAPAQKALNFACAVGALVAKKSGANPIITEEEINNFLQD